MIKHLSIFILAVCPFLQSYAQADMAYDAIVAQDGSGKYTTVQAAVDDAPSNCTWPWRIFVKNGSYEEQVTIPKEKTYIHLIGEDRDHTIIHLRMNVGGKPKEGEAEEKTKYWECSVHNPASGVYQYKEAVCNVWGDHFYAENIAYVNDFGVDMQSGPQALAMSTQADCVAFYRCAFRSYQDTWMTSKNDSHRLYVKECYIEGAVDYFYGGGDALLENCTFYNLRSGAIIVAPCHKEAKWGYVFKNCIVDGNELAANVKRWGVKLGRPWHNSPKAVYINTTLNIPIAAEGWTNMGTIPALFAEYGTRDTEGNEVDLSQRKTTYQTKESEGSCRAVITQEEAEKYTYEEIIVGKDGWNPRSQMKP